MTWRAAVGIHAMSRSTSKEEEKRGEENIPDPSRRLRDVCSANSMNSRKREREKPYLTPFDVEVVPSLFSNVSDAAIAIMLRNVSCCNVPGGATRRHRALTACCALQRVNAHGKRRGGDKLM